MCDGHDHDHGHGHGCEDEIDIVDLIGVVIKRRIFVIWFIICFTVLGSAAVLLKEYKKSSASLKDDGFIVGSVVTVHNDLMFSSFMFFNRSNKPLVYKDFVNSLLFPSQVNAPLFKVRNEELMSYYVFVNENDAKNFIGKYNKFVEDIFKLKEYNNAMDENAHSICLQLNSGSVFYSKDTVSLFDSRKDFKNCNTFYYYYSNIREDIARAIDIQKANLLDGSFFNFITDTAKDISASKAKIIEPGTIDNIKNTSHSSIDKNRTIKYSVLIFILSLILSLTGAFIIEFWSNNRKRITGYWR